MMRQRLTLGFLILISLSVIPAHSNDIPYSIQKIEEGIRGLRNVFCSICSSYLGCYRELSKRVLNGYGVTKKNSMTKEKCLALCKERNFIYAGLQYAHECFCGNKLNTNKQPEKECNMPCSGNKIQMCGGNMRLSVYRI